MDYVLSLLSDSWHTMWTKLKLYINHFGIVNDVNDANKANAVIDRFTRVIVKFNWGEQIHGLGRNSALLFVYHSAGYKQCK